MENKNKYILTEEFEQLLENIPKKYKNIKYALILIYDQGYKIKEAFKEIEYMKTRRNVEWIIKKYSNGLIKMGDLRRSYLFSNPSKIPHYNNKNKCIEVITPKLRWIVLSRDNFRCVDCGKSSKEEILNVDYIIPLSKGGKNELINFKTLCGKCNIGDGIVLDLELKGGTD